MEERWQGIAENDGLVATLSVWVSLQVSKCRLTNMPTLEVEAWTALGDPTRREIFKRLADRPLPVGELAAGLPVSRPAVSQHLKVLKNARLVADEKAGNRRIYRVDPHGINALRADLEEFWTKTLAAYKEVVDQAMKEAR
jgi:DNA-binding transcriptional ArsR family regulator